MDRIIEKTLSVVLIRVNEIHKIDFMNWAIGSLIPQIPQPADLIPQIPQVADLSDPHTRNLRICGIDEIKGLHQKYLFDKFRNQLVAMEIIIKVLISRIWQLSRFKTAHSANPQPADFADLILQIRQVADLADSHTRNLQISGIDEIKGLCQKYLFDKFGNQLVAVEIIIKVLISRIGQLIRFKTAHSANLQPADFADLITQIPQVADLADPHTRNLQICGIDEIKGL